MTPSGTVWETYVAAIQHDLAQLDGGEYLAGVARRPTPWFHAAVDANYPELGPPADLLEETKARQEDMQMQGLCEEGALNAAWETVEFERRYREYLADSAEAPDSMETLAQRVHDGEDVVLVCYEGDGKRCHRHVLREELAAQI
jgi:hypothetical protein